MSFLQNAAQKRSNNGSGFEIEVIQTLEGLHTVVPQWWQFLQDNVDGNSLENDPTYIQLRLETQESGSPFLEGTLSPWIILLRRSGRIRCIAPFSLQSGRYNVTFGEATLVSLSSPILKLFGRDFIVAKGENRKACYDAVFRMLRQHRSSFGFVSAPMAESTGSIARWSAPCQLTQARWHQSPTAPRIAYSIEVASSYEHYLSTRSAERLKTARYYERLLRNKHAARLERITAPDQVPNFLSQVDEVFRNCWQAESFGYRPRNTPAQFQYFTGLAQRGWLRSYALNSASGPMAYVIGTQYGATFDYLETGYAQAWDKISAGTVLLEWMLEDLFKHSSPRLIDFGAAPRPIRIASPIGATKSCQSI